MRRLLAAVSLAIAAIGPGGCSDGAGNAQTPPTPPAVPVGVATAEERTVPVTITSVGTVQAYTTVSVKAQVAGQIEQVHFTEGRDVKRGDLLFTIDPRPYEAAVRQSEANLARNRAQLRQAEAAVAQRRAEVAQARANLERDITQLENARVQEARYRKLIEQGMIAREQYDQVRTTFGALEATVRADQAAVENAEAAARAAEATVDNARAAIKADEAALEAARLQLEFTRIRAPMDGRTGSLLVQAGNVVKVAEDTPLVVINQVRPIYVSFAVPEQHLAAINAHRAQGALRVEALPAGAAKPAVGELTFVNNAVDPATGTIQLKATFPNTDDVLWPGQFVDVSLTLTREPGIVIPAVAVQAGQHGSYVFVVKPDLTVESRPVTVARRVPPDVVIADGVRPGERVVTDGQLRLVPGARVEIKGARPS